MNSMKKGELKEIDEQEPSPLPRFKVTPKACGFRSGVDELRLNALADELEMEELLRKLSDAEASPRPAGAENPL